MTIATIREKLHAYINTADDKKIEAIYTLVEDEITEAYDIWGDEAFVAEMDRRLAELENGSDKGTTWEEVKRRAESGIR